MLQVREGDAAAFEELMLRYQNRLLNVISNLVPQRELAEDLVQDVFLREFIELGKPTNPARSSRPGCSPSPTT